MHNHKQHLRARLLLMHQNRSMVQMIGEIINNSIKTMSMTQKSFTFSGTAVVVAILVAGVVGPSASSVAYADAQDIVNRGFARLANLTEEQKAELGQKFQDRIQLKGERGFMGMRDLSTEEINAKHEEMKASLAGALTEAQSASDLQVVSADEMPRPGFVGRAGRAFGFGMTQSAGSFEEKLANLPDEVRQHIEEREELHKEMAPASFLIYTNTDGQKVTLGINADDEPVIKFIQPEDGEFPQFPHKGKGPFWKFGQDSE